MSTNFPNSKISGSHRHNKDIAFLKVSWIMPQSLKTLMRMNILKENIRYFPAGSFDLVRNRRQEGRKEALDSYTSAAGQGHSSPVSW